MTYLVNTGSLIYQMWAILFCFHLFGVLFVGPIWSRKLFKLAQDGHNYCLTSHVLRDWCCKVMFPSFCNRRSYSRQGYGNQERPRSRQGQGYAEGERTRDGERPRSRQGYQDPSRQGAYPEQESRPRSKSRQGYDQYYKGYDRKDPRAQDYYKGQGS